jgi:hypothetical protein
MRDDASTPQATTHEGGAMSDNGVTRRRVLAGALGAGLATAAARIGLAQDDAATPEAGSAADPAASPEANPDTGTGGQSSDGAAADAAEAIGQATAAIAAAQQDRDAVADQIDPQTVDRLLAQATGMRDQAQTLADAGDGDQAWRIARAVAATAKTATDLVEARLIAAGLPSQEAPASRVLAEAHAAIQGATDETASATDADVQAYVANAQELYQGAFDLFGTGAFSQATATARVAADLARIGLALASPEARFGAGRGREGGRGGRGDGRGGGRGDGPGRGSDPESDEPVTVPEPGF